MTLGRDDILQMDDRKTERVYVPQWGDEVIVGTMSALDSDRLGASFVTTDEKGNTKTDMQGFRVKAVALSLQDDQGNKLFDLEDATELGKKSPKAVTETLYPVVARLNGLDREEVEKNSETAPTDNSSSP